MIAVIVMFKSLFLKTGAFGFVFKSIGEHWFTFSFPYASWSIWYDGRN